MRTTIEIDDDLMREIKERAHREGTTVRRVLNSILRRNMQSRRQPDSKPRYACPTFSLGPTKHNLDKALALADALEDAEIIRKLELRK